MQQISRLMLLLLLFCIGPEIVQAEEFSAKENNQDDQLVEQQLDDLGIEELKGYWEDMIDQYGGYLPEMQKGSFMELMKGEKQFSMEGWVKGIIKFAFQEIVLNGKLLGTIMMLTIFCMFLQSLQNAFEQGTISKIAYAIVFIVLIIMALNSFHSAMEYAEDAIERMIHFILALIPFLLALIATSGGFVSATFFHPVIIFLMNTSGMIVQYIVLPLLFLSTLLSIVSQLSVHYKVTQLAQLLRNWSIGILGAFMTIFLGVISVQGTSTAVTDGVAMRTAKFVTGNFVPVIGKMFTDAADTVVNASVLLKNTVGIAGVAILLIMTAFPAIKILIIALIYKFAAAILQPLGSGPIINCLDTISKSVIYIFASLAIVSIMFFLCITIIITAGNITMMVR
ncbi:stage III sporulation protein AE [Oikeobacillus pervagus]|uniref:Stage III sporulation protein AE n=1 Tax=Oikeobacillus pervagus TaxID=1325931 RepID=A0AAJ1SYY9_9BACI|nr:stage III sporulation protein AE [Oikeobacillus pervagus]MDQ0213832.1 stage III sporulation protein AE [Oikeobacillus pervagus]